MLSIIGCGLEDERSLSLKAVDLLRKADTVYLESYTSPYFGSIRKLEDLIGKKIQLANRTVMEEGSEQLLQEAKEKHVALLIVGDIFSATTHVELFYHAKKEGIAVTLVHNASVLTAIGDTGLSLYKFGQVTSLPFFAHDWPIESPYDVLKQNSQLGFHTLFLLDLKPEEQKFMSVKEAFELLLAIEAKRKEGFLTEETLCLGCAALGTSESMIKYGKVKDLMQTNFPSLPHCVIVPGKLHFFEEEVLDLYKI